MAEKNSLWKNIRKKAEQNRRTGNKPKEPTKKMLRQEKKIKANQKANGGPVNTLEGDLISKVIMNRNRDKDFVQRAYAVGEYPESNMFVQPDANEFGQKNSHLMSWGEDESGQAYMYPEVMNPNNEAIKVPNQYADYISSTGYKKATGIPYAQGGKLYPDGGTIDPTKGTKVLNRDGVLIAPPLPEFEVALESNPYGPVSGEAMQSSQPAQQAYGGSIKHAEGGYMYYAEGGETDPPYRPLGIPMEGYEPDVSFYTTPSKSKSQSENQTKKPNTKKPTSKRSDLQNSFTSRPILYLTPAELGGREKMQPSTTATNVPNIAKVKRDEIERSDVYAEQARRYQAELEAETKRQLDFIHYGEGEPSRLLEGIARQKAEKILEQEYSPVNDLDVATDIMQLGNFVPHPVFQAIGKIGSFGGAATDLYQAGEALSKGNYGDMAINLASAGLGAYLGGKGRGYTRDMNNTVPGSMADKIANLGSRSGTYRPLTATPNLRNNDVIKRGLNYNRGILGTLGAETIYDSKAQGGYMYYAGGPMYYARGGFMEGLEDVGKLLVNTVASPIEQISGNNFVNWNYNNKWASDAAAVSEGIIGAATDVTGSVLLPGVYGQAKGAIQGFTKNLGHSTEYQRGANKWSNTTGQIASSAGDLTAGIMSGDVKQIVGGSGKLLGTIGSETGSKELSMLGQAAGIGSMFINPSQAAGSSMPTGLPMDSGIPSFNPTTDIVNQGLSFAASGGNINNNSLNLQTDSMRNRYKNYRTKYSKGGNVQNNNEEKLEYFGMTKVPNYSGYHYENPNGGSYGGENASFEKNEIVLHAKGGSTLGSGEFVFPSEVNGTFSRPAFLEVDENGIPKPLNKTIAQFVENEATKGSPFRKDNNLGKERVDATNQKAMEMVAYYNQLDQQQAQQKQMMVDGALQYAAAGGKLNKDIEKIVMEEYAAAYGGKLPNKYKGKVNMPSMKAKGGPTDPPDKFNSFWRKSDSTQYAQRGLRNDIMDVATKGIYDDIGSIESARKFGYNPSYQEIDNYYKDYGKTEKGKFEKARVEGQAGALKDYQNNKYLSLTNQDVIDLAERVIDNNGSYNFDNSSSHWDNKVDLTKTLNKLDLNRVKSMVDFKIKNKSTGGNIYAQGGPMVSNIKQPFEVSAQNRGGMMMARGGNMPGPGNELDPEKLKAEGYIEYSDYFYNPKSGRYIDKPSDFPQEDAMYQKNIEKFMEPGTQFDERTINPLTNLINNSGIELLPIDLGMTTLSGGVKKPGMEDVIGPDSYVKGTRSVEPRLRFNSSPEEYSGKYNLQYIDPYTLGGDEMLDARYPILDRDNNIQLTPDEFDKLQTFSSRSENRSKYFKENYNQVQSTRDKVKKAYESNFSEIKPTGLDNKGNYVFSNPVQSKPVQPIGAIQPKNLQQLPTDNTKPRLDNQPITESDARLSGWTPENPWGNQLLPSEPEQIPGPYNPSGQYGFYGTDASGNPVSINPNMVNQYEQGWKPKGPSNIKTAKSNQPNQGLTGLDYASMIGQAAAGFHQLGLGLKGGDPVNYQRITAEKIDPTVSIILAAEESRRAQDTAGYNIKQNAPTSGSYLSNMRALGLGAGKQRASQAAGLQQAADVENARTQTGVNAQNAQISMQEQIDRLQEKDAARTNITEGLSGIGSSTANMIRDYRTNQINQMIAKNIGTNDFKFDSVNETITYRHPETGKTITVPAQTVIPSNVAVNVGTGQIQQPGTSQFETGFSNRLNEGFRNRFRGPNSGK